MPNKILEVRKIQLNLKLNPAIVLNGAGEACLAFELVERGLTVERQKALPVKYRGVNVDCDFGSKNSLSANSAFSAVNDYPNIL